MEEELVATLRATLEPDATVIKAAQDHLQKKLHLQPAVGMALLNIVHAGPAAALPLAIRQAAAVDLSLWIKERWSPYFPNFEGFPAGEGESNGNNSVALPMEYKEPVRQALLNSCTLEEGKLRGPLIKALVDIASCDWPDEFPALIPRMKDLLSSQQRDSSVAIQGALSFLDDWFYNSMDETSLMSVTKEILPDVERILSDTQTYSATIRCRCVSIFNQMLETLWMVKEQYPEASKAVTAEVMPRWLSKLEEIVSFVPSELAGGGNFSRETGEQLGLQAQSWTTISTATHFPAQMKSRLASFVSVALTRLVGLQAPFERFHMSSTSEESVEDLWEGEASSSPASLASKIIDFVGVAMQNSLSKSTTSSSTLSALVPILQSYSRITADEEEEWLDNVSAFVAAGDEDEMGALNSSMRGRCADILSEIVLVKEAETLAALKEAVSMAHQRGVERLQAHHQDWWKEEEAVLALIGGISDHIAERLEDAKDANRSPPFDVETIFATSVLPYMQATTPHFLYGRCFVFASQFSAFLPEDLAKSFLTAAVEAIESPSDDAEGSLIVKISAVRCLKNFNRHLPAALVQPYSGRIAARLGPLLASASEDTLVLIVETLQAVALQETSGPSSSSEQAVSAEVFGEIVSETIKAWAKEASDRILQSAVEDLLEAFAAHRSPLVAHTVIRNGLILCANLLEQERSATEDKYRSGVAVEGALEFAGAIARGASGEALAQSSDTVLPFLAVLFATLQQSDDREVFKNSATLLTSLVSKLPEQMLGWHDAQGVSSIQHILVLISKMISPEDTSESGGLAVGDLLTTILRKKPESLSSQLPQLCTTLASQLASSESTLLAQSLVLPLAYLIRDHLDTVVGLLTSQSALLEGKQVQMSLFHILLRRWCEYASNFQGFWNTRVSSLGLCAILKQSQALGLDEIIVDGDLIPEDTNIIKTRSRAKMMPDRFTQIPISAKILKILVGEYRESVDGPPSQSSRSGQNEEGYQGGGDDIDDDDDDEDGWDDDEDFAKKQRQDAFLSDMLGEDIDGGLDSLLAQHDEEQYKDDPLYTMAFRTFLADYFRQLAQDGGSASRLAGYLSPKEIQILQSAIA